MTTYNNIQDISTSNLEKLLKHPRFQEREKQNMIKEELEFRSKNFDLNLSLKENNIMVFNNMMKVWKG